MKECWREVKVWIRMTRVCRERRMMIKIRVWTERTDERTEENVEITCHEERRGNLRS